VRVRISLDVIENQYHELQLVVDQQTKAQLERVVVLEKQDFCKLQLRAQKRIAELLEKTTVR
jgi:hypothetical protein